MPKFNLYQSLHTTVVGPAGQAARGADPHRARCTSGPSTASPRTGATRTTRPPADIAWLQPHRRLAAGDDRPGRVHGEPEDRPRAGRGLRLHAQGPGHHAAGRRDAGRLRLRDPHRGRPPLHRRPGQRPPRAARLRRCSRATPCEIFTSQGRGRRPVAATGCSSSPRRGPRNKIRQWFSRERREDAIETGREELVKALRREGLPVQKLGRATLLDEVADDAQLRRPRRAARGDRRAPRVGRVGRAAQVAQALRERRPERRGAAAHHGHASPRRRRAAATAAVGVHVEGLDDVMVRLSRCCTPVPGDEIIGLRHPGPRRVGAPRRLRQRRVARRATRRDRLIEVEWDGDRTGHRSSPSIEVKALDRSRLLRDVADALAEHHVNILSLQHRTPAPTGSPKMRFEFELADPVHLDSVLRTDQARSTASTTPTGSCPARADRSPADRVRALRREAGSKAANRAPVASQSCQTASHFVLRCGTRDVLPPESARWEALIATLRRRRVERPGTGCPSRRCSRTSACSSGSARRTDIVRKEMYDFEDKGGRHIALRPEGTASVVRAFVQHRPADAVEGLVRRARTSATSGPRRGRYRQHHQVGIEALGTDDPDLDVEVIALGWDFLAASGCARSSCSSTRWATPETAPATSTRCARCLDAADRRPATSRPGDARRRTRCGCSTRKRPATPGRRRRRAAHHRAPAPTRPRRTSSGCRPGSRRSASRSRSNPGSSAASTTTRHTTFEFASRRARRRPRHAFGGGGRYDGLVEAARRSADARHRVRLGHRAHAAGLRRRGRVRRRRIAASTCSSSTPPAASEALRPHRRAARAPASRADRAFDDRSMKAQMKAADRSGAPLRGHRRRATSSPRAIVDRCGCAVR